MVRLSLIHICLAHTNAKSAVVGISGGLDSTLALLVTAKAFDALGLDRSGTVSYTHLATVFLSYKDLDKFLWDLDVDVVKIRL